MLYKRIECMGCGGGEVAKLRCQVSECATYQPVSCGTCEYCETDVIKRRYCGITYKIVLDEMACPDWSAKDCRPEPVSEDMEADLGD